ncbi:MAG: MotA/TolQ/ExbB proton channel family protein [Lentisphaerae bacterium]|nr:MotA/TolQ/ExbB proton channel family protein [Lentisphaerota bacterium]
MLEFLRAGGPMLWLIIFFGMIGIYVFLEKFFQLRRNQVNVRELVTGLVNVLKRDAMIEAITLCDTTPGPVAKLLNAAIQAYQNDDDIKPAIEDTARTELNRLESRLNILSTIANIAPLLGLLGTVIGMYDTFSGISASNGMSLAALSGGVKEALITTAAGLCVAIPAHLAYNYLLTQVQSLCADMEKASSEILYFFAHRKQERKK